MNKIYAFIDSQNLNLGVGSMGWQLDFARFRKYLTEKYHVSKAFLFIGFIPDNQSLYTYLQDSGYIVVFKPTIQGKKKGLPGTKGNIDAELVMYTMIEYPNYTKAIIISGDGDFYCLIDHLATNGKLLKVIAPNRKYSSLLRKFSSSITMVELFKDKVKRLKKRGIPSGRDPLVVLSS